MDRRYKRTDRVNVYENQSAKDCGRIFKTVERVPYSRAGFDSYEIDGRIMPGYFDSMHPAADGCVILDSQK